MATRKRSTMLGKVQTYSTRIIGGELEARDLAELGAALVEALSWGFEAESKTTREACAVLMSDVMVVNSAALEVRTSERTIRIEVRHPVGSALSSDYADALRDLAHVVRLQAARPGYGGLSEVGFAYLSDLLVEHMDALADGRERRTGAAA
jgi:hypothetical protein